MNCSQPAACCLLFCPLHLSPPRETRLGFTSLHFTSLYPWETYHFVSFLLRNFGLTAFTTTTHLLFKAATQAGHCPLLAAPIFLGQACASPPHRDSWGSALPPLFSGTFSHCTPALLGRGEGGEEDGRAVSGSASSTPDGMVLERLGLVKLFKPTAAWQPGGHNGSAGGGMFPHA